LPLIASYKWKAIANVEGLNAVYGEVTNYNKWYFVRSLDRIEPDEPTLQTIHVISTQESFKEITERIFTMLL
jgi:hypothetical protein